MEANGYYIEKSYKISKVILFLLTFAAISIMINFNADISRYLFGLPIVISGILGVYGSIFIIKGGFKEPYNEKKVIAITVNFAMVLLILAIVLSNTIF